MSCITNDGSDVINKKIITKTMYNNMSLENFEMDSTIEWIKNNNFKRVGLQFPDELLPISIPISLHLKSNVDCHFGIMADTSYSSCCIDEVGGEHFTVEAIVHYGNSCLTPTHRKLPVKYVFGHYIVEESDFKKSVDIIKTYIQTQFHDIINRCVTILYDFRYIEFSTLISNALNDLGLSVHDSFPNLPEYGCEEIQVCGSRIIQKCHDYENSIILFITDDYDYSVKTSLLSLFHCNKNMIMFGPKTNEIKSISSDIQRFLRSRLYSIEVAKESKRVGLLLGTLSIENYLEIYQYLCEVMQKAGKLVYPLVIGKINPNKLANFADLDVLVIINCAESCLQFSDKKDDYYKPVVTPYEMICACDPQRFSNPFSSPYLTDFKDLLKEENKVSQLSEGNNSEISLISGKIVQSSVMESLNSDRDCNSLISRLDSDWSISAIDKSSRSWFGLDPQLGQTQVAKLKDGRSGIAAGYENEKQ